MLACGAAACAAPWTCGEGGGGTAREGDGVSAVQGAGTGKANGEGRTWRAAARRAEELGNKGIFGRILI